MKKPSKWGFAEKRTCVGLVLLKAVYVAIWISTITETRCRQTHFQAAQVDKLKLLWTHTHTHTHTHTQSESLLLLEESVDMASTSSSFSLLWPGGSRPKSLPWWGGRIPMETSADCQGYCGVRISKSERRKTLAKNKHQGNILYFNRKVHSHTQTTIFVW